jgi:hypothetical protein
MKRRKVCPEFGVIEFTVRGPIPRTAPYKKGFRGRLYVPDDVKAWRRHIATNFILCGGRKPLPTEQIDVEYLYKFVDNHADHDSITHSAQDALSKDACKCDDKEWWLRVSSMVERAPVHDHELIRIKVTYGRRGT